VKKIFLTAGLAYVLALTFIPTAAIGDDSSKATGQLIDELMAKNSGLVTAESALPTKRPERTEEKKESKKEIKTENTKNAEASEPVFSGPTAAKDVAKVPESKSIWGRLFLSLFILACLGGGAFYFLKRWPGAQKLKQRTKMIEVLNQQYLGPKKSLAVIRVAGEAVLIGITDNNITLLKTLSLLDDDVPTETQQARFALKNDDGDKFQKTLNASVNGNGREDDFSMAGLKEIIGGKLKGMREF
jgi:flagellar protein FliO/FliZ